MTNSELLIEKMVECNIKLVATLPDTWLAAFLRQMEKEERFIWVPVSREEEGVGVCCGAWFGGINAALVMPNSGFLTCGNSLNGLAMLCQIPVLMMISYRGVLHETEVLQTQAGGCTTKVLEGLGIPYFYMDTIDKINLIPEALNYAKITRRPVAVLLSKEVQVGKGGGK